MASDLQHTGVDDEFTTLKDKYLTFHIGKEDYGIPILYVIEIIGMQKITEVPRAANYIKGVINLRGKVIPVMDIRLRFRMTERTYDERTCIIVVQYEESTVGLVVDTVSEVVDIPEDSMEEAPDFSHDHQHFVTGMGKIENEIKMIIDIHRLLHDDLDQIKDANENYKAQ